MDVLMELSRILITEMGDQQVIFLREKGGDRTFPILIGTGEALAIALRRLGLKNEAALILDKMLELDPLNYFAFFEKFLLRPNEANQRAFTSLIRSELPHETYLELAMTYVNLRLDEEAATVLKLAPVQPVVCYWLAYLNRKKKPGRQPALSASGQSVVAPACFPLPQRRDYLVELGDCPKRRLDGPVLPRLDLLGEGAGG